MDGSIECVNVGARFVSDLAGARRKYEVCPHEEIVGRGGGNDLYELNYGVVDPMRSVPLQSFEAMWSSAPLQWDWKGTDEHNLLVNPGPYLAVVEWVEHSTGRRGVDRCMVAVAPGQ